MSVSIYRITVPVFIRALRALSAVLEKGAAFGHDEGLAEADLIGARLAPDMMPLAAQIQRASDTAKFCIQRLINHPAPAFKDEEASFEELQARIAATITYLDSIEVEQMRGCETNRVDLNFGEFKPSFSGEDYVLNFALPNFYFHVTTAYDILRHMGVQIGKRDFLGQYP